MTSSFSLLSNFHPHASRLHYLRGPRALFLKIYSTPNPAGFVRNQETPKIGYHRQSITDKIAKDHSTLLYHVWTASITGRSSTSARGLAETKNKSSERASSDNVGTTHVYKCKQRPYEIHIVTSTPQFDSRAPTKPHKTSSNNNFSASRSPRFQLIHYIPDILPDRSFQPLIISVFIPSTSQSPLHRHYIPGYVRHLPTPHTRSY